MYYDFDQMSDNSRVWIFQAAEHLPYEKTERISARLMYFLDHWQAHGKDLEASFTLRYGYFIVVALDEASYQATGCSIDKLTHLMQQLENELKISLLDRTQIAYRDRNQMIQTMHMVNFRAALEQGEFDQHSQVFNNLVSTKKEWEAHWETSIGQSWHKQWLPVV
ncbi:MAG: hypothetical protein RI565_02035 [Schleiferiaceae bacterium]|nr:hypothetical protein [Schleiferiaceae bacterium]